jgi:hypothetical protein
MAGNKKPGLLRTFVAPVLILTTLGATTLGLTGCPTPTGGGQTQTHEHNVNKEIRRENPGNPVITYVWRTARESDEENLGSAVGIGTERTPYDITYECEVCGETRTDEGVMVITREYNGIPGENEDLYRQMDIPVGKRLEEEG